MKDDRGDLDLEKQISNLKNTIKFYQQILRDAQKQIYFWKKFWYESQKKENLLQGYKKVIENLSNKLNRKDK
jgi:predicted RNase H-like nuclease (RuvC/YqgF family)|tara:strand:+ start:360 stop:575 length:216 start_codon:yes stop_codon:yes gene_type:complete